MSQSTSVITLDDVRAHRDEILRVATRYGARNVRVFGSVARGNADSRSDLDILVDLNGDADGFAYFGVLEDLRRALARILGRDVHVVDEKGLRKLRERTIVARDRVGIAPPERWADG